MSSVLCHRFFARNFHPSSRSNTVDSGGRFKQFCRPLPRPHSISYHMKSLTRTSLSLALALATMTGLAQDAVKKPDAKPLSK